MSKDKRKKKVDPAKDMVEIQGMIVQGFEAYAELLKKAMIDQQDRDERLVAIIEHCMNLVNRFPDEVRAPIVAETGVDIPYLASAITLMAQKGNNNAAMVLAEVLYSLGYEAAKNEASPKFKGLD